MRNIKLCLFFTISFMSTGAVAHMTIFGFGDTLSSDDKKRLANHVKQVKKVGYKNNYYSSSEDTIVSENDSGDKIYFR
jgi:hypothetical protein